MKTFFRLINNFHFDHLVIHLQQKRRLLVIVYFWTTKSPTRSSFTATCFRYSFKMSRYIPFLMVPLTLTSYPIVNPREETRCPCNPVTVFPYEKIIFCFKRISFVFSSNVGNICMTKVLYFFSSVKMRQLSFLSVINSC